MGNKGRYATLLGLKEPWEVTQVDVQVGAGEGHVWVALPQKTRWVCPQCLSAAPIHDHQERIFRPRLRHWPLTGPRLGAF